MNSGGMSRLLLLATLVGLLTMGSMQNEFTFLSEPIPTIYTYEGRVTLINCTAVKTEQDGRQRLVEVTVYRNSEPISKYFPPDRHQVILEDQTKIPYGLLISRSLPEDTRSTYSCAVVVNNVPVISTVRTTLYVGDGRPFPVSSVVQLGDQQLYSLTVGWDPAPSPPDRPIQGYTVIVNDPNMSTPFEMDVDGNDTEAVLMHLQPGTAYGIIIFGRSEEFEGQRSEEVFVYTLQPIVPPEPDTVNVVVEIGNRSSSISVSWTLVEIEPDVMTPVDKYVVFFGTASSVSELQMEETSDNRTSVLTIADIKLGGNYTVGVAAVNSAGRSPIAYFPQRIVLGCGVLEDPINGRVRFRTSVGSEAVYSCSEGCNLIGSSVRHCLPNGEWSGTEPTCELLPDFTTVETEPILSTLEIGVIAGAAMFVLLLVGIMIVVLLCFCRMRREKTVTHSFDGSQGSPSVRKSGKKWRNGTRTVAESSSDGSFNSGPYTSSPQVAVRGGVSLPNPGDSSASGSADSNLVSSTTFMIQ